jgi:hypothetical protein
MTVKEVATLTPDDYINTVNSFTGERKQHVGPKMAFLEDGESIERRGTATKLANNQYVVITALDTGKERCEKGPQMLSR